MDITSTMKRRLRLEEKLMSQDKVDFLSCRLEHRFNLAVVPIFAKYGYLSWLLTLPIEPMRSNSSNNFDCRSLPQSAAAFGGALIEAPNKA